MEIYERSREFLGFHLGVRKLAWVRFRRKQSGIEPYTFGGPILTPENIEVLQDWLSNPENQPE